VAPAKLRAAVDGVSFDIDRGQVVGFDSGATVFRLDAWQLARLAPPESTLKARKPKKF